ncbi:hypothetical protein SAMN05444273_11086 [Litoreibacter ascidiaceicola]|uniref:Sulfotransferase family protein n=1 Tax=Litoreibacter ascidiaceicola TaxID=1486859 RepID=A0A1M5DZB0_9RHOB|nr:sulfotransferase [Litoreibacter ascidiaceicola]SHF72299.1 hypothetical protein SAMN05444273_11086 [Litoreibacter ascidiaceicola]
MANKQTTKPRTANKTSKASKGKATAIVVLGMHRSGTSALSGILYKMGCVGPKTPFPPAPNNEKGFFESKPLSDLLDQVLGSGDSSWQDWRPFNPQWMQSVVADPFIDDAVDMLAAEYPNAKLFVLKNPRLCRLMPFCTQMLEQAKIEPFFIHTHRNPIEVAASLVARNKISATLGHLLWLRHVLDAEIATRGRTRYFTNFTSLLNDWGKELTQFQDITGFTFPRSVMQVRKEVSEFLAPDLRHHEAPTEIPTGDLDVSGWTRSVFSILQRWAGTDGNPKDFAELDEIRDRFDELAINFGGVIQDGVNFPKAKSDAAAALRAAQSKLVEVATAKEALQKQNTEAAEKTAALQAAHAIKLGEIAAEKTAAEAKAQADADALAKLTAELAATQSLAEQQGGEAAAKVIALENEFSIRIAQVNADKDAVLAKAQTDADELTRLKGELATTQSALEQRSLEAEQSHTELGELHAILAQQSEDATAQFKTFETERDEALTAAAVTEAKLRQQLSDRFDELAQLGAMQVSTQKALDEAHIRNHQQGLDYRDLQEQAHATGAALQAVKNSTSWKLTAPLRRLMGVLRSMTGRGRK